MALAVPRDGRKRGGGGGFDRVGGGGRRLRRRGEEDGISAFKLLIKPVTRPCAQVPRVVHRSESPTTSGDGNTDAFIIPVTPVCF